MMSAVNLFSIKEQTRKERLVIEKSSEVEVIVAIADSLRETDLPVRLRWCWIEFARRHLVRVAR